MHAAYYYIGGRSLSYSDQHYLVRRVTPQARCIRKPIRKVNFLHLDSVLEVVSSPPPLQCLLTSALWSLRLKTDDPNLRIAPLARRFVALGQSSCSQA